MNIPSAWAMQITGVNRLRFNEAVFAGLYPCAPPTEERRKRYFGTNDVIALYAFGQLTSTGITPRVAGEIACSIAELMNTHGDSLEAVIVAWKADGTRWVGPWFGVGKDEGRPHLDPTAAGWTLMFQFSITEIGKEVFRRYYELHQSDKFDRSDDE